MRRDVVFGEVLDSMRGPCVKFYSILFTAAVLATTSTARAQQYLYTNDNVNDQTNSTTALRVNADGKLTIIKTYSTGGKSSGAATYFASHPIAYAVVDKKSSCLFVSNGGDSTIAAFSINTTNGELTAVKGSPFAYGVSGDQSFGVSLATGNNQLLFAANSKDDSISVLKISSSCSLQTSSSVNLPYSPVDFKVTPNEKDLIVTYMGPVDSFVIDYTNGSLTEMGPFSSVGSAAGLDILCDSSTVFFGDAAAHTEIEAYRIESDGSLEKLKTFTNNQGTGSSNVMVDKNQSQLFVTNNQSNEITVLAVDSEGVKSFEGIVKLRDPGKFSAGLAQNKSGAQIYVSEARTDESIGVLNFKGHSLKEVPSSPFNVIQNGFSPAGLLAVPAFGCNN
jgi:6-phosphogluconolactonase (cycloisomerase 2 family)